MKRAETNPDDYLRSLGDGERFTMAALDKLVVGAMPGRSRVLWTGVFWGGTEQAIIGYGDIVHARPKGHGVEWFAVGLARQKRHYSVYVNAVENGRYLSQLYQPRLGKVRVGAASIGFVRVEDVDLDVLRELVEHADRLCR
jgi:hypothetical protein